MLKQLSKSRFFSTKRLMLGVAVIMLPMTALASADPIVDGARQCTQYFPAEEQKNGIPNHLLAAIASTESGRWHNGIGLALPWPWTINVEGKGYYFDTKAEAIAHVAALQKRGVRSIDVGCMQVSLLHHPNAFASLDQAFDPATNVAYGATFLRENYDDLHDWVKATAAYHSRTPVYGKQYLGQIEKSWNRIVSKIQEARAQQGLQPMAANTPKFDSTPLPAGPVGRGQVRDSSIVASTTKGAPQVLHPVAMASNSGLQKLHGLKDTHGVRVIKVSDNTQNRRASDSMVVQNGMLASNSAAQPVMNSTPASYAPASRVNVKLADANDVLTGTGSDSARQVHLGSPAAAPTTDARFVFAN